MCLAYSDPAAVTPNQRFHVEDGRGHAERPRPKRSGRSFSSDIPVILETARTRSAGIRPSSHRITVVLSTPNSAPSCSSVMFFESRKARSGCTSVMGRIVAFNATICQAQCCGKC